MALSKFTNQESRIIIEDKYPSIIPALYYSSGVDFIKDKDKIGAFDFSSKEFPDNLGTLCLHQTQFEESIQETRFPPACMEFIQDLRASSYILLISNEIDEKIIGRVIHEFKLCLNQYGNHPRELFIVSNNIVLIDYIRGKKEYKNDLEWVDIRFSDKLNYFEKIHDRFAILDNHIWHFGAGIGGMHKTFHALSGPWEDVDHSFRNFCEKIFF